MTPRLVAMDGPLTGSSFELGYGQFSIGRKPENSLVPADSSLSRHHCTIECDGEQYRLNDHDSQNGTFVNGIPVTERILAHGDRISVGASVFAFLHEEVNPLGGLGRFPDKAPVVQHRLIGESPAIRHVVHFIGKVAPLDCTVLITGEKGTGKKLAAQSLHENCARASKPFVTVNCAALSEPFLESEIFGHERASLAVAVARRRGALELAEGGTLFLDEIAALPLRLQEKLQTLLEEKCFERIGGVRPIATDVRVIASTSSNLSEAVHSGAFLQELYFQLRVFCVEMPPLRQRRVDIPLLANYFRVEQSARYKRRVLGITAAAHGCLTRYDWPGNVRELEGAIESAIAVGSTEGILPEDLPENVLPPVDAPDTVLPRFSQAIVDAKRELILKAFQQTRGSHAHAASLLGLHPSSLHRMVRALGLQATLQGLWNS